MVGIEVPNKQVTTVALREVIDSPQFSEGQVQVLLCRGQGHQRRLRGGETFPSCPICSSPVPPARASPVCMNSIIISLLYKAKPEEVKLIMVDPKMVELGELQWHPPPADPRGDRPEEGRRVPAMGGDRDDAPL